MRLRYDVTSIASVRYVGVFGTGAITNGGVSVTGPGGLYDFGTPSGLEAIGEDDDGGGRGGGGGGRGGGGKRARKSTVSAAIQEEGEDEAEGRGKGGTPGKRSPGLRTRSLGGGQSDVQDAAASTPTAVCRGA